MYVCGNSSLIQNSNSIQFLAIAGDGVTFWGKIDSVERRFPNLDSWLTCWKLLWKATVVIFGTSIGRAVN